MLLPRLEQEFQCRCCYAGETKDMHSNRRIYAAIVPRALVISTGLGSEPAFVSCATRGDQGHEVGDQDKEPKDMRSPRTCITIGGAQVRIMDMHCNRRGRSTMASETHAGMH